MLWCRFPIIGTLIRNPAVKVRNIKKIHKIFHHFNFMKSFFCAKLSVNCLIAILFYLPIQYQHAIGKLWRYDSIMQLLWGWRYTWKRNSSNYVIRYCRCHSAWPVSFRRNFRNKKNWRLCWRRKLPDGMHFDWAPVSFVPNVHCAAATQNVLPLAVPNQIADKHLPNQIANPSTKRETIQ